MALKGFTFWRTYCDVGEELSEKDQKEFYFAIIQYLMYDNDIEEKLTKNARIAFKCIKTNLKTSRSRSQSGKSGNEARWGDGIASESQTNRKAIANESQVKDKYKDKDKGRDAHAACPKCGGALERTGCHKNDQRMYRCEKCHEEVWL